jgi:hypothetical protein
MRTAILTLALATMLAPGFARAATQAEAQAALDAAHKADAAAAAVHNQWIPTEAALKLAAKELSDGKYDESVAASKRAQALAGRSVQQAQEQAKLWRNEVIR